MSPAALCRCVRFTSAYVAGWIGRQPEVKEESITDWSLDRLTRGTGVFAYRQFSRHEEGKVTGADWEWWIVGRSRAFKARVQAKRLNLEDNHPGLAYGNKHSLQIVKLIADAEANDSAAIYMFYATNAIPFRYRLILNGMFVADAHDIDDTFVNVPRRVITQQEVLNRSVPFPSFFCRPGDIRTSRSTLNNLARFVSVERAPLRAQAGDLEFDEPYVHTGVPVKIEEFLQSQRERVPLSEGWFLDHFETVSAVFVIDLRRIE